MASLRKLRRRLRRWDRYAEKINHQYGYRRWNGVFRGGHMRASRAYSAEQTRRFQLAHDAYWPTVGHTCFDCGLPDLHNGRGDGIGSCECPRCQHCGAPPEGCDCDSGYDHGYDDDWCDDGCWDEPALGRPVETLQVGEAL